jgi:hypothetical protein
MTTISIKARSLANFIKRLGRDDRGEDETHQSLGISRMGKVIIVGTALIGTAGTMAAVSNNSSATATTTSQQIGSVNGTTMTQAAPVSAALKGK